MKEKPFIVFALFGILLFFMVPGISANDMELEIDNGDVVILHIDHTWDFKSHTSEKLTRNISLILDNGKTVQINKNHSWYYVQQRSDTYTSDEVEFLGTAYSTGNAQHTDLIQAKMKAMSEATVHLSKQLLAATGDQSISFKKLNQCIEREDKDIEIKEQIQNKIWRVMVRLSVDKIQIQMIIDCAREMDSE